MVIELNVPLVFLGGRHIYLCVFRKHVSQPLVLQWILSCSWQLKGLQAGFASKYKFYISISKDKLSNFALL